jgi:predicted transglutaminase-like cysteine proteinase
MFTIIFKLNSAILILTLLISSHAALGQPVESRHANNIAYEEMLFRLQGSDDRTKIQFVNRFFNTRIAILSARAVWGDDNYWAHPNEVLEIGVGSDRDIAAAKYIALKRLGFNPNNFRIGIVSSSHDRSQRAVLLISGAKGMREYRVMDYKTHAIVPTSERRDLLILDTFSPSEVERGLQAPRQKPSDFLSNIERIDPSSAAVVNHSYRYYL